MMRGIIADGLLHLSSFFYGVSVRCKDAAVYVLNLRRRRADR